MLKIFLTTILALFTAAAFAAVDVNKADQAELESIKGIGPSVSAKILNERKKGSFKDWPDLVDRVQGVGPGNAAKFSAEGLTVNGNAYSGTPASGQDPKNKKSKAGGTTQAEASSADAKSSKKNKSAGATSE